MQQNFKKDSRVWLHKNSTRRKSENEKVRFYTDQSKLKRSNHFEEEDSDCIPFITGDDGKAYKKDSRAWLHKSSVRSIAKVFADDALMDAKDSFMFFVPENKVDIAASDRLYGSARSLDASDSTRPQYGVVNAGKRKKNEGRRGLTSISHRDIHTVDKSLDDNLVNCNHCRDKRPRFKYGKGSFFDNDNSNKESSSDSDYDDDDKNDDKIMALGRVCERRTVRNCERCDASICRCRSATNAITPEGLNALREIAKEMQVPLVRRSTSFMDNDNFVTPHGHQAGHRVVSSHSLSESKSSLDVCGVDLSDESINAHQGDLPKAESEDQLTQATRGLNVQSPKDFYCAGHMEQE